MVAPRDTDSSYESTRPILLSVVIPVFNEERTLREALARVAAVDIPGVRKELVVVDDGSTDQSRAVLEDVERAGLVDTDLVVLLHELNRGKGAALRTGFASAAGDLIVVQDADLEYDPRDIAVMVETMIERDLPVVYGSRLLRPSNRRHASLPAYLGGRTLTAITNLLYPLRITDEPTCYKLFRRELLDTLDLRCERFEFCPEVTARLGRLGVDIAEVPISYDPRSVAEGKKIGFRDFVEAVWVLLRERLGRRPAEVTWRRLPRLPPAATPGSIDAQPSAVPEKGVGLATGRQPTPGR